MGCCDDSPKYVPNELAGTNGKWLIVFRTVFKTPLSVVEHVHDDCVIYRAWREEDCLGYSFPGCGEYVPDQPSCPVSRLS